MKRALLCLLMFLTLPAHAQNIDWATTKEAGQAPDNRKRERDTSHDLAVTADGLRVELLASDDLAKRAEGVKFFPKLGCSYKIDWGDRTADPKYRSPAPMYCASDLKHTYKKPGTYTIQVLTFDFTEVGTQNNGFYGKTTVTVR